jgi:hypothetical protein
MRIAILAVPLTILSAAALSAATPLATGMRIPAVTLADQHDAEGSVRSDTRCVLFSRDMSAAKIVQEALGNDPAALPAATVIISDISGMPGLITKLFALPALRKRPYRILLDREGKATEDVPSINGKVTVLYLRDFTIERVEFVDSADALRTALHQAAEPQPNHRHDGGER